MKKILSVALSASLLIGSMAVNTNHVQASSDAIQVRDTRSTSSVLRLTIDDVVDRAVSEDRNLIMLGIQYEILEQQKKMAKDAKDALGGPVEIDENQIKEKMGLNDETEDELIQNLIDAIVEMEMNQLEGINTQLDTQRKQLKDSIEKIDFEKVKHNFQTEEAKEGIRYMMKARFVELVGLEEGLELQKSHLNSFKGDIQKAKLELELGIIAADSVRQVNRDFSKQERSLKEKENEYNLALNKLRLDLGYSKDQRIKLVPSFSKYPNKITHPSSSKTKQLIENTYQIKKINEDIKQKENLQDSSESNSKELEMLKVQREQTKINIEKHIASLYTKADNAYAAWEEKRLDKSDQSYDERKYTLHYELGLISKHEYDKTTLPIKQANFEELMARMSYILITEEIKALENGVVLTQ